MLVTFAMENYILNARKTRIFGLASFDLLATLGFALLFTLITAYFKSSTLGQAALLFLVYSIALIALGILLHYIVGANTQLNYQLGLSACPPNLKSLSGIFKC